LYILGTNHFTFREFIFLPMAKPIFTRNKNWILYFDMKNRYYFFFNRVIIYCWIGQDQIIYFFSSLRASYYVVIKYAGRTFFPYIIMGSLSCSFSRCFNINLIFTKLTLLMSLHKSKYGLDNILRSRVCLISHFTLIWIYNVLRRQINLLDI
jgi:hypothetical protein